MLAGVEEVGSSSTLDLRYRQSSESLQPWRSSELIDIITGLCLGQTTACSCNCPGNAPCQTFGTINFCLPCSCAGSPSCPCSERCPPGAIEETDSATGMVQCKCRCSDFGLVDLGSNGTCQVSVQQRNLLYCTLNGDHMVSVAVPVVMVVTVSSDQTVGVTVPVNVRTVKILRWGLVDASVPMTCNGLLRSVSCDNFSFSKPTVFYRCPNCPEGLEPVWQDCVCSCQSKQGRGGLPPVCSDGWKGPYCDVPDCSPWPCECLHRIFF